MLQDLVAFDDPAQELIINALQVRPIGKTNFLLVLLEGRDPARTKKLLELLLEEFKKQSEDENWMRMDDTKSQASTRLMEMKKDLEGDRRKNWNHAKNGSDYRAWRKEYL